MQVPIAQASEQGKPLIQTQHKVGLILGSGWPKPVSYEQRYQWPYRLLPGFSEVIDFAGLPGHASELSEGHVNDIPVLIASGRLHLYQGYSAIQVTAMVRYLHAQGITHLILTNVAGSLHSGYSPGNLMFIADHINFTGHNPLLVEHAGQEVFFTDCQALYSPRLRSCAVSAAETSGLQWHEGVYVGVLGCNYETPAEVRMLKRWGADAVGMSTVLEALQAHALEIPVFGVSFLSNFAAGITETPLSHHDVLSTIQACEDSLSHWLTRMIEEISHEC